VTIGGVVWFLRKPTYTADAWLLIKERSDVVLKSLDLDTKQFVSTQFEMIRSPQLLGPLAQNPAIRATPELQHESDVALAIGRRLQIKQRGQSDIYIVSFTSNSPEKAELIVKEVTEAYVAFYSKRESEQDNRIIRLLEENRAQREAEMRRLRENLKSLSLQQTGIDPFRVYPLGNELSGTATLPRLLDMMIQYEVDQEVLAAQIKEAEERHAGDKTASESEKPNADKLTALKLEYAECSLRLKIVKAKVKEAVRSGKQYTGESLELESLRSKLQQITKIHDELVGRILAITTEQRAPPRVELFKEASLPSQADGWGWWRFFPQAGNSELNFVSLN